MANVLLIGSRGREHAIAAALKNDSRSDTVYCIPGNGGLSEIATCVDMKVTDYDGISAFLKNNPDIEMTVISPDEVLAAGFADRLKEEGHRVFGPSMRAAQLEASKSFAREFCERNNIPAPSYHVFDNYESAKKYVQAHDYNGDGPIVIKTEGRTAGKGILFCKNSREAGNVLYDIMVSGMFGAAGKKIVIEECLKGESLMVMAFCDGTTVVPALPAECFKRVFDVNQGMSTAGMGACVPAGRYNAIVAKKAFDTIIKPTVDALKKEGSEFKGVIGFNLIIDRESGESKAVDFTVRFCDVETQALLPLLETPLLDIFNAVFDGTLDALDIKWSDKYSGCVILTAGGYPLDYSKNTKITIGETDSDVQVLHAGTKLNSDGEYRVSGGRVLSVVAVADDPKECMDKVYDNIKKIDYAGMHYRKDIMFREIGNT